MSLFNRKEEKEELFFENHYNYNLKCLFRPTYVLVPQSCALVKHNPNCKRLQTLNTPGRHSYKSNFKVIKYDSWMWVYLNLDLRFTHTLFGNLRLILSILWHNVFYRIPLGLSKKPHTDKHFCLFVLWGIFRAHTFPGLIQ